MNCPHCNQAVEDSAAFCGNCGQPLSAAAMQLSPQQQTAAPAYAVMRSGRHSGETKALLSLLFGLAAFAGVLLMAIVGLVLGVTGIVMGSMSRSGRKRNLSTVGLVISSLAVVASLAVWSYAASRNSASHPRLTRAGNSSVATASHISTPCYFANLVDNLNISQSTGNCNASAFDGLSINNSTNIYKVYATSSGSVNETNFKDIFKQAVEKDIKSNLPGFTVSSEGPVKFAGSAAYVAVAFDKQSGTSVAEGAVLHKVAEGENVFVLVHATKGSDANLDTLEAQWQWR